MSQLEFFFLYDLRSPFESGGPGESQESQEWKFFSTYLNTENDEDSLYERHGLSDQRHVHRL